MTFLERFDAFRKTVGFRALYLVLVGLIVGFLLPIASALGCLLIVLLGVAMFGLPYVIGERRVLHFFLNALVILLVGTLVSAALFSASHASATPAVARGQVGAHELTNGTVTPFAQASASQFTFRVDLRSEDPARTPMNVSVYVVLVDATSIQFSTPRWDPLFVVDNTRTNLSTPLTYSAEVTLNPGDLHYYRFEVFEGNVSDPVAQCRPPASATTWEQGRGTCFLAGAPLTGDPASLRGVMYGPISADYAGIYGVFLVRSALFMLFPFFTFLLILTMYWWVQRARELRGKREAEMGKTPGSGEFTCSNCGADVPEAAARCPKCGAVFDEAPADHPLKGKDGPGKTAKDDGEGTEEDKSRDKE